MTGFGLSSSKYPPRLKDILHCLRDSDLTPALSYKCRGLSRHKVPSLLYLPFYNGQTLNLSYTIIQVRSSKLRLLWGRACRPRLMER